MSVTDRAIQGIANATRVRSLRAGHLMAIILLIVAACGGSAQPSPSAPTITAPARSIAPRSPAPVGTITHSNAISAVAGFERWLAQTDLDYDLAVDGVALNWGPTFGMVHVEGPDSFQLIPTEGMAIWVFERSSLGGRTSRSVGVAYQPAPAQLLPVERLQDALAASTGWVDAGTKEEGGRTLHHLLATTTAISDQGLTSATGPADPHLA